MAASAINLVIAELNKFKKGELIDFIISKKLPEQFIDNAVLRNYFKTGNKSEINEESEFFSDTGDNPSSATVNNCGINAKAQVLEKLNFHLEKRICDQELIIKLLNEKNENNKSDTRYQGQQKSSVVDRQTSHVPTPTFKNASSIKQSANEQSKLPAPNVNKHNSKHGDLQQNKNTRAHITGSAEDNTKIKCGIKHAWFYVGKVHPDISEIDMNDYLKNKCPGGSFEVKKVSNDTSVNSSFRVRAVFELFDTLNNEKFWPKGIIVRRYKFFQAPRKTD